MFAFVSSIILESFQMPDLLDCCSILKTETLGSLFGNFRCIDRLMTGCFIVDDLAGVEQNLWSGSREIDTKFHY